MFMVLSSWQSHCESSPAVHLMNVERHQATADHQIKPNDLGCESTMPESTPTIATYYYYSARKLKILIFTIARRIEG